MDHKQLQINFLAALHVIEENFIVRSNGLHNQRVTVKIPYVMSKLNCVFTELKSVETD